MRRSSSLIKSPKLAKDCKRNPKRVFCVGVVQGLATCSSGAECSRMQLFDPYFAALGDYKKMKGNSLLSIKLLKFACFCSEHLVKFVI